MSDADLFEASAQANFGQLLLKAARLLDERALARVRSADEKHAIRPAHTRLFPHISHEGVRPTELAARLGVTKQAVTPLIADLTGWGMVETVVDPADGRARLVRWTPDGLGGLLHGLGVLTEFERELADKVGPDKVAVARSVLAEFVALLAGHPQENRS